MTKLHLRLTFGFMAMATLSSAAPVVTGVVNAASYTTRLAPGTWTAIFGTWLASSTAIAPSVPLGTSLGGVTVTIANIAAPLNYVSATQINAVIPFEIPIPTTGSNAGVSVPVVVTNSLGTSAAFNIVLWRDAPAIFTKDSSGSGEALAFDANFKALTAIGTDPIVLYATGLGPTSPAGSSNSGGISTPPYNTVLDPLTVTIGDKAAAVGFAGLAPGFPGIYQLNVTPGSLLTSKSVLLQSNSCELLLAASVCTGAESSVSSNSTTISAGSYVTNVKASIDGIYPATGANIAAEGASASGPGSSLALSLVFSGANFTLDFDVVPGASPFNVVAATSDGGGSAVIAIDPAHGTWQATLTSPTAAARTGDFSSFPTAVLDLFTCNGSGNCSPLPGNILPPSRFDQVLLKAFQTVPLPNSTAIQTYPINGVALLSGTLTGNHFSWNSSVAFGGFSKIAWSGIGPVVKTTVFTLTVDGLKVASTSGTYRAY